MATNATVTAALQAALAEAQALPAPTPAPVGATFVKFITTTDAVILADAGQRSTFVLHGSSGQAYRSPAAPSHGEVWKLIGDETMGPRAGIETTINVWNGANWNVHPGSAIIYPNDSVVPDGKTARMETMHSGYIYNGVFSPYTERRLRATAKWIPTAYPQIDPALMACSGSSMGADAVITWGVWQTDLFSYCMADRPRFTCTSVNDWTRGTSEYTTPSMVTDTGASLQATYNGVARIANPANKMVPLLFVIGAQDATVSWPAVLDAIAALKATGRAFACLWNQGTHVSGPPMATLTASYTPDMFRVGQAVPVLSGSTLDNDPTVDLVGGINVGFKWRNLTASTFELTNTTGAVDVDATYAGVKKHLSISAAGVWVKFDAAAVPPPPAPTIATFTATPAAINAGQSTVLNATFANGSAKVNGNPAAFPLTVSPLVDTTYVLVVTGAGGTAQAAVDVKVAAVVVPLPPGVGVPSVRTIARPAALIMAANEMDNEGHTLTVGFSDGGRYLRGQYAIEVSGATANIVGFTENVKRADGTIGGFQFGQACTVTATLDGVPVGTKALAATDAAFSVTVNLAAVAEGWHMMGCTGLPAGWGVLEYPLYVRKGAQAVPPTTTPVVVGSLTHEKSSLYASAWVPAQFAPVERPLLPRTYPSFTAVAGRHELVLETLAPIRGPDVYRPSVLPSGAVTTANRENYFYADIQSAMPLWPLLDGPRGRGTVTCATALRESIRPGGNPKVYFVDPWRFAVVDGTGTVRTLAGYRHKQPPQYTNAPRFQAFYPMPAPELVGDWSAVPLSRRGFHELWDMAWDGSTLALNLNAAPIGGEQPHLIGPTAFLTDTQNGRVCKLVFNPTVREAPPVVTEFITGLLSPWGCECVGNVLYVSEQAGNKVGAYDKDTGAPLWSVPIIRAEGLRHMDGVLYVGSLAGKCVYKLDVNTHAVTKFIDVPTDNNSNYVNVAVSDGTAWPRGTVATVTWSNTQHGFPCLFDATTGARFDDFMSAAKPQVGPPGPYPWAGNGAVMTYATAVSIGGGRMTFGSVQEGLVRISRAVPTDVPLSPLYDAGQKQYIEGGYVLTHGDCGFGFYGLPLPFGKSPEMDAYLHAWGH